MATIGPVAIAPGLPATLGPFSPTVGATAHGLTFGVGAWAGTRLFVQFDRSDDGGQSFQPVTSPVVYGGPASAWTTKQGGAVTAIAPQFGGLAPATAQTRVRYIVSVLDGSFASAGGSYDSA